MASKPQTLPGKHQETLLQPEANKGGRPTTFNEATAAIICNRLAEGETLTGICKTPGMPARQTVHIWRRKFPRFDDDYRQARADQQDTWGDDCIEIADDSTFDTMETTDKQGNSVTVANHANVQRDKLRINTRQFFMARLSGTYSDKREINVSGSVNHSHSVSVTDRERMRRLASLMLEDQQGAIIDGTATDLATPSPLPATQEQQPVSNESQSVEPDDKQ